MNLKDRKIKIKITIIIEIEININKTNKLSKNLILETNPSTSSRTVFFKTHGLTYNQARNRFQK